MEAARTLGGRARATAHRGCSGLALVPDNGQHIPIGAYTETLRLMRVVGVDAQRHAAPPLTLTYADRSGLELPDLPSPGMRWWVWRARGWSWTDRSCCCAPAPAEQLMGFRCDARWSVAQLCERLPQRLLQEFIEPLCVSALNTRRTRPARKCSCACCATACSAGAVARTCRRATGPGGAVPGYRCAVAASPGAALHGATRDGQAWRTADGWTWMAIALDSVVLATHSTEAARPVPAAARLKLEQGEAARVDPRNPGTAVSSIGTVYARGLCHQPPEWVWAH